MFRVLACGAMALSLAIGACNNESPPAPRPPSTTPSTTSRPTPAAPALPPDHPRVSPGASQGTSTAEPQTMADVDISGVVFTDARLTLTGISASIPEGWIREDPGMNPQSPGMSRKAQFRLPKTDKQAEDAVVAVTHFPGMRGMNDQNLQRWYGMFTQPDGRPTREVARKASYVIGPVSVTLVDIRGTMRAGPPMMGGGATKENHRMLAAIVDHPKGPHFIKVSGPADVIERWKPSVVAFLKSMKVNR